MVEMVAPRTPIEQALMDIWAEAIGMETGSFGVHENFFEIGGHSLSATRVMSRVRQQLGASLPLRTLFQSPTVAGLAELVLAELSQAEPKAEHLLVRRSRAGKFSVVICATAIVVYGPAGAGQQLL